MFTRAQTRQLCDNDGLRSGDARRLSSREVLQSSDAATDGQFECGLERSAILDILDEASRTWRVDAAALQSADDDLQAIVNCSEEGDIILLEANGQLQFTTRVTLPWQLTISGSVEETALIDGVFPETRPKQRIACPNGNEGVFLVQARDVLLANMIFEDCTIEGSQEELAAIVEVEACRSGRISGRVQLHHVNFVQNRLNGAAALTMNADSCSALELVDVEFERQTCTGFCGAVMSTENELRNVRIRGTVQIDEVPTIPAVLYAPRGSRTAAENIHAVDNEGAVIYVDGGELEISDCEVLRNEGEANANGDPYAAGLHLESATVTVRRCRFEDNVALEGAAIHASQSTLTTRSSVFSGNEGENGGAAVYLFRSVDVTFINCTFVGNSLPQLDGAAIRSNRTQSLTVRQSTFSNNTGGTGAALYAVNGPLEIEACDFETNVAVVSAGGVYFEGSDIVVRDTLFSNNGSPNSGGAAYIVDSSLASFVNLTCFNNSADYGGCIRFMDAAIAVNSSLLRGNSAISEGGGLAGNVTTMAIHDCLFEGNSGDYGGGMAMDVTDSAQIENTRFLRNNATSSAGGGIWRNGRIAVTNCTFEENRSDNFGAAFTCGGDSALLTANQSIFLRNVASDRGAGTNLILGCRGVFFDCRWIDNRAPGGSAAGALMEGGVGFFFDGIFEGNLADSGAAARLMNSVGSTFTRVTFRNNNATSNGGAVQVSNSTGTISDCLAEGNVAFHGGAFQFNQGSNVTIERTTAVRNNVTGDGGAVGLFSASGLISDSVFNQNFAVGSGGSIDVADSTLDMHNVTVANSSCETNGGGLSAFTQSSLNFTNCLFSQNETPRFGGSILMTTGTAFLTNTTIERSRAENAGGGAYVSNALLFLSGCNISGNYAEVQGGGIHATGVVMAAGSTILDRNVADNQGGGINLVSSSVFTLGNMTLTNNRGVFGGAVAATSGSSGTLNNSYAFNNSALTSGGVAYVDAVNVTIENLEAVENSGFFGGSIVIVNARLDVFGSEFLNGSATFRGADLSASTGSFIVVEDSRFTSGTAEFGGAVYLLESYFWGRNVHVRECRAEADGGAMVANDTSSAICTGCIFENNYAGDKGGAVYLESQKTQLLAFQFDNCTFSGNSAVLGGGLHFVNEDKLVNCSEPRAECTFVALRGTHFRDNDASAAGGAILSSDLNAIRVSCSYEAPDDPMSYLSRRQFEALPVLNSLDRVCSRWRRNRASDYGADLASYARRVQKVLRFEEREEDLEVDGNVYFLQNHRSGTQIPSLFLTVVDELGQGPATGSGNETIEATMWSPDRLFTGALRIQLEEGAGNFSGIAGYREAGFYDVRVDFSEGSIPSFTIRVGVRSCVIGEAVAAGGTICQQCNGDTYNFFPERPDPGCEPCPDDAKCDTAVIRPRKGHWHSSPCSKHIQECLTTRACDEHGRDERLKEIGSTVEDCDLTTEFIENYTNAQCREGYRGPLCGSCESEFGRSRSFRCEKCFPGFGNFVLVLLSVVVLLMLSGFAIRSSLPSHRRHRRENGTGRQEAGVSGGPSPREPVDPSTPPVNLQMVQMLHTGIVPPDVMEGGARRPQETPPQNAQRNAELTKWKAVEIFKITINYVQVIAVAIAVNVDWTSTLIIIFEAAEFLGGVTSEAATRSVDCLISSDSEIPRSAVRTVVNVMVPMLVTALYFIVWAVALIKLKETADYLIKRCILSFMAVSYLSYIALTKTVVNVLSCVDVHDSIELDDDSTTEYWAVDTSLECYRDSHAVLAALMGWPILFLFSFGFPVAVASLLVFERNKHGLKSEWLFESMGFMYRAYSGRYVFWESVIMLRKAVLAVVVVFSYSLGGNLQGVLGVCVLMVALYFQIVCGPFRPEFDDLNNYEGLSLLVSALTFVSGLFFNDDRTSEGARVLLTVFLVIANIGIFLFFVAMFWKTGAEYLKTLMDAEGTDYNPDRGAFHIVRTYVVSRVHEYKKRFLRNRRNSRRSGIAR